MYVPLVLHVQRMHVGLLRSLQCDQALAIVLLSMVALLALPSIQEMIGSDDVVVMT